MSYGGDEGIEGLFEQGELIPAYMRNGGMLEIQSRYLARARLGHIIRADRAAVPCGRWEMLGSKLCRLMPDEFVIRLCCRWEVRR